MTVMLPFILWILFSLAEGQVEKSDKWRKQTTRLLQHKNGNLLRHANNGKHSLADDYFSLNTLEDGLFVTRTMISIPQDTSFHLDLNGNHCTTSDEFGVNHCHYNWGDVVSGVYSLNVTEHINVGDVVVGNFKVDLVVPWDVSCALCGQDCVIEIPVVNINRTIQMPPCPVTPHHVSHFINHTLQHHSPTDGIPTHIVGHVRINKANGTTLASFVIDANLK